MAIYKFRCDCGVELEHVQPMSQKLPDALPCPKCGSQAKFVLQGAPAVARSGMTNAPVDTVIGRDAEARWSDIYRRQEVREKVRQENQTVGLTAIGKNDYQPLSEEKRALRSEAKQEAEKRGTVDHGELSSVMKKSSDN